MSGIFSQLKQKILSSPQTENKDEENDANLNNLIALGVLLWTVAQADDKFLPEEKDKVEAVLREYNDISEKDMPIVLRAIEEASINKIDIHSFTSEVKKDLTREQKLGLVENLFRVACADKDLDLKEHEMIRKICDLFRLTHKEFIDSKIRIKKEFGLETVD